MQVCILVLLLAFLPTQARAGEPPSFVLQWGVRGVGDGQFSGPHGIEVDAEGDVYVAETGNNVVQKFTSDGIFIAGRRRVLPRAYACWPRQVPRLESPLFSEPGTCQTSNEHRHEGGEAFLLDLASWAK